MCANRERGEHGTENASSCSRPNGEPIVPGPVPTDRVTWLLLIARGVDEVRCELSLPAAIGDDGRVESWSERIILAPVGRDGEPTVSPADQEPDIVVEVSRRAV